MMNQEVTARAGGRYERSGERQGHRNGRAPGYVVVGGRKVKLHRLRQRDAQGRELPPASYHVFQDPVDFG